MDEISSADLILERVWTVLVNSLKLHLTLLHTITFPMGYPCQFSSFPSVLNGLHSLSLIGECEFCHHLINVQVSAHSGSSAPVGTSVHAHPCSHRGVRRRKLHTHSAICTCKVLSLWLLKAKLGRL